MRRTLLVLIVVGLMLGGHVRLTEADDKAPATLPQPIKVTVDEMLAQHKINIISLDQKYSNQPVELTGVFRAVWRYSVGNGETNEYGIHLIPSAGDASYRIRCTFDKTEAKRLVALKPGDVLTVKGTCRINSNGSTPLVLEECTVVKVAQLPKALSEKQQPNAPANKQRVEYKLVDIEYVRGGKRLDVAVVDKKINELATEGWEYVERIPELAQRVGDQATLCVLFKRTIPMQSQLTDRTADR